MYFDHMLPNTWLCFLDFKLICLAKQDLRELWITTPVDAMSQGWSFLTSE